MTRLTTEVEGSQSIHIDQYNDLRREAGMSSWIMAYGDDSTNTLKVLVNEGSVSFGAATRVDFTGGYSPEISNTSASSRIDVLSMQSSTELILTQGVEDDSPTIPDVPSKEFPICAIYMRHNAERIDDEDGGGTDGYIYKDLRAGFRTTPTCKTLFPQPMARTDGLTSINRCNSNTTLQLGMAHVPYDITVNKISFRVGRDLFTPGTLKLVVYSEDGQTKKIEHETAYITETGLYTETLSSGVELVAGVYYMGILSIDTCDVEIGFWNTLNMALLGGDIEPAIEGHLTVTADTIPSTITPNDIEYVYGNTPFFRLDN